LEMDETAVAAFVDTFADDARAAGTKPDAIATASPAALKELAPHRDRVVSRFAEIVASRERTNFAELSRP